MATGTTSGPSGTKERIVEATAELFRRQGYTGTGVKRIVEEARAPFGSIYHFFPGGKEQLGEEVIRSSGASYLQLVPLIFDPAPDVARAVADFFAGAAETLAKSGYEDACPIATVALEVASTSETLRRATADVFASWIEALTRRFVEAGIPAERARTLASATLAGLEGAFVLSRAMRTTEAMDAAGALAADAVRTALGDL